MNAQIIDYSHNTITTYIGEIDLIYKIVSEDLFNISAPLISSIDPYGITYFNHNQVNRFIKDELLELKTKNVDIGITQFLSFIGNMKPHQYLKIIGE